MANKRVVEAVANPMLKRLERALEHYHAGPGTYCPADLLKSLGIAGLAVVLAVKPKRAKRGKAK